MSRDDIVMVFSVIVRCRILIDFHFYKTMKVLKSFMQIMCYNSMLLEMINCTVYFLKNAGSLE